MESRAEGVRVAYPLFNQVEGGGSTPTSALDLWVYRITAADAVRLNARWHSRLPRIGDPASTLRAGLHYAATYQDIIYAVAIWTHPVSRVLPQREWLELRRLAVAPDAPRNTASRMLRIMAILIRRDAPAAVRLVSYQDTAVHTGGIYRAAGWVAADIQGSQTRWTSASRRRPPDQSTAKKQRWEKAIR